MPRRCRQSGWRSRRTSTCCSATTGWSRCGSTTSHPWSITRASGWPSSSRPSRRSRHLPGLSPDRRARPVRSRATARRGGKPPVTCRWSPACAPTPAASCGPPQSPRSRISPRLVTTNVHRRWPRQPSPGSDSRRSSRSSRTPPAPTTTRPAPSPSGWSSRTGSRPYPPRTPATSTSTWRATRTPWVTPVWNTCSAQ